MLAQKTFEHIVREVIHPTLKAVGFAKKNLSFYRKRAGLTEVINLQCSQWNSWESVEFFINIGIYATEIEATLGEKIIEQPKEYQCHFRKRIEQISPFGGDR